MWQIIPYQSIMYPSLLKVFLAIMIGFILGADRELHGKPAGLRTFILITLGACIYGMLNQFLFLQFRNDHIVIDQGRFIAQLVTGLGFLGSGVIFQSGIGVRGVTNAALIWSAGCLGALLGHGFVYIAVIGAFTIFLIVQVHAFLERLQERWAEKAKIVLRSQAEVIDLDLLINRLIDSGVKIERIDRIQNGEIIVSLFVQLINSSIDDVKDQLRDFRFKYGVFVEKIT